MARNARINMGISPSVKERLLRMAEEHNISQADIVEDALRNFFEKQDRSYSAPDLVLDRINALTLSVMELTQVVGGIKDELKQLQEHIDEGGGF